MAYPMSACLAWIGFYLEAAMRYSLVTLLAIGLGVCLPGLAQNYVATQVPVDAWSGIHDALDKAVGPYRSRVVGAGILVSLGIRIIPSFQSARQITISFGDKTVAEYWDTNSRSDELSDAKVIHKQIAISAETSSIWLKDLWAALPISVSSIGREFDKVQLDGALYCVYIRTSLGAFDLVILDEEIRDENTGQNALVRWVNGIRLYLARSPTAIPR